MSQIPTNVIADVVEHLVKGIVNNPDDVAVDLINSRKGKVIEINVNPDDLGKVIGRGGRTVTALRLITTSVGGRGIRIDVLDPDKE